MILTCCLCGKDFKVNDPLLNICNRCSKKSIQILKKWKKQSNKFHFSYSDFLKFEKENPREDKSFNEMLVKYVYR